MRDLFNDIMGIVVKYNKESGLAIDKLESERKTSNHIKKTFKEDDKND